MTTSLNEKAYEEKLIQRAETMQNILHVNVLMN